MSAAYDDEDEEMLSALEEGDNSDTSDSDGDEGRDVTDAGAEYPSFHFALDSDTFSDRTLRFIEVDSVVNTQKPKRKAGSGDNHTKPIKKSRLHVFVPPTPAESPSRKRKRDTDEGTSEPSIPGAASSSSTSGSSGKQPDLSEVHPPSSPSSSTETPAESVHVPSSSSSSAPTSQPVTAPADNSMSSTFPASVSSIAGPAASPTSQASVSSMAATFAAAAAAASSVSQSSVLSSTGGSTSQTSVSSSTTSGISTNPSSGSSPASAVPSSSGSSTPSAFSGGSAFTSSPTTIRIPLPPDTVVTTVSSNGELKSTPRSPSPPLKKQKVGVDSQIASALEEHNALAKELKSRPTAHKDIKQRYLMRAPNGRLTHSKKFLHNGLEAGFSVSVRVSRVALAGLSRYFRALFSSKLRDARTPEVVIEVSHGQARLCVQLIKFLHTGCQASCWDDLPADDIFKLILISDRFCSNVAINAAGLEFLARLTEGEEDKNFFMTLDICDALLNLPFSIQSLPWMVSAKSDIEDFLVNEYPNIHDLIDSDDAYKKLTPKVLEVLLKSDQLKMKSENTVFQVVYKWFKHQHRTGKKISADLMDALFKCFRYQHFTDNFFRDIVRTVRWKRNGVDYGSATRKAAHAEMLRRLESKLRQSMRERLAYPSVKKNRGTSRSSKYEVSFSAPRQEFFKWVRCKGGKSVLQMKSNPKVFRECFIGGYTVHVAAARGAGAHNICIKVAIPPHQYGKRSIPEEEKGMFFSTRLAIHVNGIAVLSERTVTIDERKNIENTWTSPELSADSFFSVEGEQTIKLTFSKVDVVAEHDNYY